MSEISKLKKCLRSSPVVWNNKNGIFKVIVSAKRIDGFECVFFYDNTYIALDNIEFADFCFLKFN